MHVYFSLTKMNWYLFNEDLFLNVVNKGLVSTIVGKLFYCREDRVLPIQRSGKMVKFVILCSQRVDNMFWFLSVKKRS